MEKLPDERGLAEGRAEVLDAERRVAAWVCRLMPVLALPALPFLRTGAAYLVNLRPPDRWADWPGALTVRFMAFAALLCTVPVVWWVGVRLERRHLGRSRRGWPVAPALTLLAVAAACLVFEQRRVQWFFLEAAKARIERDSFARNVINWKYDTLTYAPKPGKPLVVLLGSSQMDYAVDERLLAEALPGARVKKRWLSGFSILQYLVVAPEVLEQRPTAIVCWLSEFDAFREDRLPTNRLRFFSRAATLTLLAKILGPAECWGNRAQLADMTFASLAPLWRDRDLLRVLFRKFWWRLPTAEPEPRMADVIARERENIRRAVRRTRLVEVNFRSFRRFAQMVTAQGVRLFVFEGSTHPDGTSIYDPGFRPETRRRLERMAREVGFVYVPEEQMPRFSRRDFESIYHLNGPARRRFTHFLARWLETRLTPARASMGVGTAHRSGAEDPTHAGSRSEASTRE